MFFDTHGQPAEDSKTAPDIEKKRDKNVKPARIGVHCVAGLGRAPLLVALALVHKGCERMNAIELIRKLRPGSLNMIQANYLAVEYKEKKKDSKSSSNASCHCSIF